MADALTEDLQPPNVKKRKVEAGKGLLDLPLNLMHEVFGPLDARSLLETANSHDTLLEHVVKWPGKTWEIVDLSNDLAIIDYETFSRQEAVILLANSKKTGGTSINICDLPYDLLYPIIANLDVWDLQSVAKCHPNLLRATKTVRNKHFEMVDCLPKEVLLTAPYWVRNTRHSSWAHKDAEILLTDARVRTLHYDVETTVAPDMRVYSLVFQGGQGNAGKCARLIEKWKPAKVEFPGWHAEAFDADLKLARVLKNVDCLQFADLPVAWLSYIPEWKFTSLKFHLADDGMNVTQPLALMHQKLYDQWISGKRNKFVVEIMVDSPIQIGSFYIGRQNREEGQIERDDGTVLRWGRNLAGKWWRGTKAFLITVKTRKSEDDL